MAYRSEALGHFRQVAAVVDAWADERAVGAWHGGGILVPKSSPRIGGVPEGGNRFIGIGRRIHDQGRQQLKMGCTGTGPRPLTRPHAMVCELVYDGTLSPLALDVADVANLAGVAVAGVVELV